MARLVSHKPINPYLRFSPAKRKCLFLDEFGTGAATSAYGVSSLGASGEMASICRHQPRQAVQQHTTNPRLHHYAAWRFALFFLGGSWPFIGDLPTPARWRTFSAFGTSATAARGEVVRSPECRKFLRYRHVDQLVKRDPCSFCKLNVLLPGAKG